jgi:hypothetical protein
MKNFDKRQQIHDTHEKMRITAIFGAKFIRFPPAKEELKDDETDDQVSFDNLDQMQENLGLSDYDGVSF